MSMMSMNGVEMYSLDITDEECHEHFEKITTVLSDCNMSIGEKITELFPNVSVVDQFKIGMIMFLMKG